MSGLLYDLRTAIRALSRRPFYPMVALGILVLGLSAGIAVFTYINGFYQPFPGVDAGRLVRLFGVEKENPYQDISYLDFLDYAATDGPFEGMAAMQPYYAASVRLEAMTEVAFLEAVSGGYFSVLGIDTAVGRGLLPDDDQPGATPVAVLSHAWWRHIFNGDPTVIGQTIYLNYRPFIVVGVASPRFLGTASDFRPNLWIPIAPFRDRYTSWAASAEDRDVPLVRVYGRLRAGVHEGRALAELGAVAAGLDDLYPRKEERRRLRLDAANWIDPRSRSDELPTLRLMIAAAAGLLLLVCANVANLLLSVAAGRQRELAMRSALGASPGRLLRQVLMENVLLSVVAGGISLLVAVPLSARLGSYFARPSVWGADVAREVAIDLRVVAFAVAISLVTGLVAGLLPALRASRRNLVETLKTGADLSIGPSRHIGGRRLPGAHDLLISAQAALSMVLLVFAGLVLRTFVSVGGLDPGFSYDHLAVTHVSSSSTDVKVDGRERLFREMAERLSEEPWVRAATVADFPPLSPHASADPRHRGTAGAQLPDHRHVGKPGRRHGQ
jgi:predicted permease